MKVEFTHKDNSGRLIIIFAGWSTDAAFYRHVLLPGWDILVVSDYSDFNFPTEILDSYETVALFAWSLGVFVASQVMPPEKVSLAVAVNGTAIPVSDIYGIPEAVFDATEVSLNERNLMKFRRRMCGRKYDSLIPLFNRESPEIEHLRSELRYIRRISEDGTTRNEMISPMRWHRVYISRGDSIFPPGCQLAAWNGYPGSPEIFMVDEPHYINLADIISGALPAKEIIGKKFHKAMSTYEAQAVAQRSIARRLSDFPGGVPLEPLKILEIGPGSGFLSRCFTDRFHPCEIDYVELYPLEKFGLAEKENVFVADAEEWVACIAKDHPASYDAVISASALQWFADPESFFRNVSRLLRPGGFMLCSTFLPGNLHELTGLNPYGLIYRSIGELEQMVRRYFLFAKLEEEDLVLEFASPRETLRHLKETGVGGGTTTRLSLKELLSKTPLTLTYRPIYIYAVTLTSTPTTN